ncbi:osteomodulin-like [Porites lutea]|uniref:osteomodulin-like n=1 Tax=Porites lutea TaxID=51062 RepID=UPI003CC6703F
MAMDNEQVPSGIPSNTVILNLAMTSLKDIGEDDFENLTLLKKLDLSQNQLRYIPQNTFRNLPLLAVINLRDNFISGGFYLPKTIGRLDLLNNLLSSDDLKVILKGLTKLSYLDVDENKLGPVLSADVFAGLSRLDIL